MKNNKKGQMLILGGFIVLVLALAVVMFFLIRNWQGGTGDGGGLFSKGCTTDACCVEKGLGDRFDADNKKCYTYTPPVGNPTQLPLVKVTDQNNQIIKPPSGQDALIMPPGDTPPVTTPPVTTPPTSQNSTVSNISLNISDQRFNDTTLIEAVNDTLNTTINVTNITEVI